MTSNRLKAKRMLKPARLRPGTLLATGNQPDTHCSEQTLLTIAFSVALVERAKGRLIWNYLRQILLYIGEYADLSRTPKATRFRRQYAQKRKSHLYRFKR